MGKKKKSLKLSSVVLLEAESVFSFNMGRETPSAVVY